MRTWSSLLIVIMILAACGAPEQAGHSSFADLPAGDAANGALLYEENIGGAPSCSGCHLLDGTALAGPSLGNYAAVAGTRVDGLSAEEYTYQAIVDPGAHLVDGFVNVMYDGYGSAYDMQQLADVIAYLLTLES